MKKSVGHSLTSYIIIVLNKVVGSQIEHAMALKAVRFADAP
jgi:hypothetical protein